MAFFPLRPPGSGGPSYLSRIIMTDYLGRTFTRALTAAVHVHAGMPSAYASPTSKQTLESRLPGQNSRLSDTSASGPYTDIDTNANARSGPPSPSLADIGKCAKSLNSKTDLTMFV